jgi:hypothetical protein
MTLQCEQCGHRLPVPHYTEQSKLYPSGRLKPRPGCVLEALALLPPGGMTVTDWLAAIEKKKIRLPGKQPGKDSKPLALMHFMLQRNDIVAAAGDDLPRRRTGARPAR